MLEVALRNITFAYPRGSFAIRDLSVAFARSEHTAIVGAPAAGVSTLLRLIAGDLEPQKGDVIIGTRVVTAEKRSRRPLVFATTDPDVPARWSVQHALIAAARTRNLDRIDRQAEISQSLERWTLQTLLDRRLDSLSGSELTRLQLARIELMRPAILVCDRLFADAAPSVADRLRDEMHRLLRVMGTTVISGVSSHDELGLAHTVMVIEDGQLIQHGAPADLYRSPGSEAAAASLGPINVIPAVIRHGEVQSSIGYWQIDPIPFEGTGVILIRPEEFTLAPPGEESDLVISVEEAKFVSGRWLASSYVSGGVPLQLFLPPATEVHKGKLLALRFDPRKARLLPRDAEPADGSRIADFIPPLRETR